MAENWWEQDQVVGGQPASAAAVPPLRMTVPPTPALPTAKTPTESALDEARLTDTNLGNEEKRTKLARQGDDASQRRDIDNTLNAISSVRSNIGGWTTGARGAVTGLIPETPGYDLRAALDTIKANIAFERLQAMRQNSPTGGAVGNVSDTDMRLLQSTVASLDPNQGEKQFRQNLDHVELQYLNLLNTLNGRPKVESLEQARAAYGEIKSIYTPPSELQDGRAEPPIGARLTPAQEQEYYELLERKPSPDQLIKFFTDRGLGGVTNAREVADAAAKGNIARAINYQAVDDARQVELEAEIKGQDSLGAGEQGPLSTLLESGATLGLNDEAAGVGRAISRAVQGENPFEGYTLGRDAERMRVELARRRAGWTGTAVEVAGGLLSANPEGAIAPLTTRAGLIGRGAKSGAIGGGTAGFGYGEGAEDSITGAFIGAGAGAGVGSAISAYASRGGRALPSASRMDAPYLRGAAERQGVPVNAANVRPGARNMLSMMEASPGSAGPIQRNLASQAEQIERGAEALGGTGRVLDTNAAGQTVRDAGSRFLDTTGKRAGKLYDRAAEAAGDLRVPATGAVKVIQDRLANLKETPSTNQARISALENILQDLVKPDGTPKPVSVQGLRDIRTGVRTMLQNMGLTASQAEADASAALNAVSDDLTRGLQQKAPDAARLYQRADQAYRERMQVRNDVLNRLLGSQDDRSAEQVFARVQAMASLKGDSGRLAQVVRTLAPDEKADLAATIADGLGRSAPGEPFSAALFARQAARLSSDARVLIFGKNGAQAVDDLQRLARSLTEVRAKLNNSRSGQVQAYRDFFRNLLLGGGTGALAGLSGGTTGAATGAVIGTMAAAGGAAIARRSAANLLLYRPFVSWLARAPRLNTEAAVQAHIRQLGGLGRGTPIAVDMQAFQRQLQAQFAPMGSLAAESPTNDRQNYQK